jgi:hypothetical protein
MKQPTQTVNIGTTIEEIGKLEKLISTQISPYILDYIFLLAPNRDDRITLSKPLTVEQTKLLENFNQLSLKYFDSIELPLETEKVGTFENYLEIQRNVYLTRFVEARKLFAEYALFSIPTKEAEKLSKDLSPELEPAISMEIKIANALIINDDGSFNFKETKEKEETSNLIKSVFSSYGNLSYLTFKSIRDLYNITTRAFLISMNQDFLIKLMEVVLQKLIIESNKLVYNYLDKGYPTNEAISNVKSLLEKSTKKEGIELPSQFNNIEKEIEETIETNLKENIKLEKKYLTDLKNEIYELLVHYSTTGKYVSTNFYKLKFIEFSDLGETYRNQHNVVELYLYDDFQDVSKHPAEAYDIDFSRDFKVTLFQLVTNGNENPNLTLEDYLYKT